MSNHRNEHPTLRERIHEVIFEADTFYGALFDILLLITIVVSVIVVCMETVPGIGREVVDVEHPGESLPATSKNLLSYLSWAFTILFTIEYLLRVYCVKRPIRYICSFWGIIDLLSFLPDYLLIIPFAQSWGVHSRAFSVVRSLRLIRVFRIFRLAWFQFEADDLGNAIWRARAKIVVFLTVVMIIVTVVGTLMFEIEATGEASQFESIPKGIYWAIVTMTTVGFGDIVPTTTAGQFLSAVLILIGYSLIIVPTGFVSAEVLDGKRRKVVTTIACASCITEGHDQDAIFCKYCGEEL